MKLLLMLALVLSSLSAYQIQVDHQLEERDVQVIAEGLSEFNRPFFGQQKGADFAVYLKDDTGKVVGGVIAWTLPGIGLLCIDTLWIPEHLRNQGFGTQLMLAAEAEGKRRGCTHAQLETLPFQGEPFYQKLGYVRIGVVKKMYGEHDAIYMRKSFDTLLVIDRK